MDTNLYPDAEKCPAGSTSDGCGESRDRAPGRENGETMRTGDEEVGKPAKTVRAPGGVAAQVLMSAVRRNR